MIGAPVAEPSESSSIYEVMRAIEGAVAAVAAGGKVSEARWVIGYLDHVDDWVVATAVEAVGELGFRETIPTLAALLPYERECTDEPRSAGEAYAMAMVSMEYVDVRLAAVRALGKLLQADDEPMWSLLEVSAAHPSEHPSVRQAAREALAGRHSAR